MDEDRPCLHTARQYILHTDFNVWFQIIGCVMTCWPITLIILMPFMMLPLSSQEKNMVFKVWYNIICTFNIAFKTWIENHEKLERGTSNITPCIRIWQPFTWFLGNYSKMVVIYVCIVWLKTSCKERGFMRAYQMPSLSHSFILLFIIHFLCI